MTLSYKLFRRPRTLPEYFDSVSKEGNNRILISHAINQSLTQPAPNTSPYMYYEIWLILRSELVNHNETLANKKSRVFKLELLRGTKSQFSSTNPLINETLETIQDKLPEVIGLCKKYGVKYRYDEKTSNLFMESP